MLFLGELFIAFSWQSSRFTQHILLLFTILPSNVIPKMSLPITIIPYE